MSAETTLLSLAMLKTKINRGQDYLTYLEPFICHAIQTKGPDDFKESNIAETLIDEFGLKIPIRTIEILLKRIAKRTGAIERRNKEYHLIGTLPPDQLTEQKVDAQRRMSAVIQAFIVFAKAHHGIELSEESAFAAVAQFLSKFSIDCIRSYLQGTVLPDGTSVEIQEIRLVCSYIKFLYETDPARFNDFMIVVEGQMLANALLCPDLKGVAKDYQHVTFYFDTPLLLMAIGLEGDDARSAIMELIDSLINLEGTVSYFPHTAREVKSVIHAAAENLNSDYGHGSVTFEARRNNRSKADLLLIAETFEDTLAKMNVQRRETPTRSKHFLIDEQKFETMLSERVQYAHGRALGNDVESVRCIYELRKGDNPESIEKCQAIFVSSNTAFAKAADDFGKGEDRNHVVSAVISSISLTNLAWLKAPMEAPLLPKREVLSYCYAALRPNDEFLKAVLATAEELVKSNRISIIDHKLLRSTYQVQEQLLDETLGDATRISQESLTETIGKVKAEIKKEETNLLEKERRLSRELQDELERSRANNEKIRSKLKRKANQFAAKLTTIAGIILLLPVALGTGACVSESLGKWVGRLIAALLVVGGAVNLFIHGTIQLVSSVRSRIANWKYRNDLKSLSLSEQEPTEIY